MTSRTSQRRGLLTVVDVMAVAWLGNRYRDASQNGAMADDQSIPPKPEGKYDIRRGAAGYSPVIGTFGALAVPAIILVFPLGHTHGAQAP